MGTIAQKLTYLDGTKQALKESINNIGGDITSETTFREYAQELDNIYDNLPKTTGEDTNLSLTTLKGKMNIIPKGDTQQNGTPTPDTPINIEVVTGTQEVKVENVNLLKLQTLTEQTNNGITFTPHYENGLLQYINVNGTATATATYSLQGGNVDSASTFPCEIKAGTYHLSGYTSSTNAYKAIYLRYTYNNSTFTGLNDITSPNFTLTQNAKIASYIRIQSGQTCNNEKVYPQLEKGSTASEFTPHQEQTQIVSLGDIELCKIGNYQDYLYKSNDKWYKKGYVGKYNMTGNEQISTRIAGVGRLFELTGLEINATTSSSQSGNSGFSNRFIYNLNLTNNYEIRIIGGTISIHVEDYSETSTFKTWLTSLGANLYYILATPNDIEITNTNLIEQLDNLQKLKSYNGVTNINCSGNLSAILGVSAIKGE